MLSMTEYLILLVVVFVAAFIVSVVLNKRKAEQPAPAKKSAEKKVGGKRGQEYMDSLGIKVCLCRRRCTRLFRVCAQLCATDCVVVLL